MKRVKYDTHNHTCTHIPRIYEDGMLIPTKHYLKKEMRKKGI
jgi:hypothetical protein